MLGRTHALSLALLLALSGCVIHVHEKGETEAEGSASSGGEAAEGRDQKPRADASDDDDDSDERSDEGRRDRTPDKKPVVVVRERDPGGKDKPKDPKGDKPVAEQPKDPKGDKPVAEKPKDPKGDKPAAEKPKDPKDDKPVAEKPKDPKGDKPVAEKPKDPKGDKPVAEKPKDPKDDKPVAEKPKDPKGDKPVLEKPSSGKPVLADNPAAADKDDDDHKPQGHEPGPRDKPGLESNKPVFVGSKDPKRSRDAAQTAVTATNKHKPQVTSAEETARKVLTNGSVARAITDAPCKLYSNKVSPGGKLRLKLEGVPDSAQVLLEGKPLKVVNKSGATWVVELAADVKPGRVTVKKGDETLTCGRIQVL